MTEQEAVLELMYKLHDEVVFIPDRNEMARDGRLAAWAQAKRADYPMVDFERVVEALVDAETTPDHFDLATDEAIKLLKEGSGYVHLDIPRSQNISTKPNDPFLDEMERRRQKVIKEGGRVAFLFTHAFNMKIHPHPPRFARAFSVTREQTARLLEAGAEWVGPEYYRPKSDGEQSVE